MYPPKFDDLLSIADKGLMLPPKSSWFLPKHRSGFIVRCFEESFAPKPIDEAQ